MSEQNNQGEKLYAGKFKTVEELEQGYNNSAKIFQENADLKKRFEDATSVPDAYNVPTDIALHESDLEVVKAEAKSSGLTQAQFEKLARERNARSASKAQSYEEAKKSVGADNINVLQDFLKKNYPEKVADKMLREAILDTSVREQIMAQRSNQLNSSVPGSNRATGTPNYATVTEKDIYKARDEAQKARGKAKVEATKRYINLQHQFAHQKSG